MTTKTETLPPPPTALRWCAVAANSITMFAGFYIYDSVGPLAKVFADQLHFTDSEIGLLQAICSFPSIFMVLLGGIFLDRIGVRKAAMTFSILCLAGAMITACSPQLPIMLAGRLVFGLGIGCLGVTTSTGIAKWFAGEKLSFVFGLNMTISRLGSLAAQISPTWAKGAYASWRTPLLIAILFGCIGILAVWAYWVIEKRASERYLIGTRPEASGSAPVNGWNLGRSYWLSVLLCVTFYSAILPFQTFAQKYFVETHGASPESASLLVGALTVITIVTTPLFGLLVDRIGRRTLLLTIGSALLLPVFLMMSYTKVNLLIPMALMGLSFSLIPAVLWPSVMLIIPQGRLGKAFGLMSMVQSIGLTGFNYLIGWTNDFSKAGLENPSGYALGMWLFTLMALAAFLFAFLLHKAERGLQCYGLEFPSGRKPAHHRQQPETTGMIAS